MSKLQEIKEFIKSNCIKYGDFTLKSSLGTNYYIDLAPLWESPYSPDFALSDFIDNLYQFDTVFIYGGDAYGLASKLALYSPYIRKLNNGCIIFPSKWDVKIKKACIVEDVTATGDTVMELIDLIPRYIKDITVLIFVSRGISLKTIEKLRDTGAKIVILFKAEELL